MNSHHHTYRSAFARFGWKHRARSLRAPRIGFEGIYGMCSRVTAKKT